MLQLDKIYAEKNIGSNFKDFYILLLIKNVLSFNNYFYDR